ncbi:ribosome biogenesis protein ytm1 [Tilletia horrida]|nr:ribosome biogenesis protein ytm1 [Tilletia horrida]
MAASSEAAQRRPPASQEAQLDLRTFLNSIHAGLEAPSASSSKDESGQQSAPTAPSLPASARVSMLDAQIDAVNTKLQTTLKENADSIASSGKETVRVQREVRALRQQVAELEDATQQQVKDRIPSDSPLLGALVAFQRANEAAQEQTSNLKLLTSLHAAVLSLEQLEDALFPQDASSSNADASNLEELAAHAQEACAELGVLAHEGQIHSQGKLSWLAREPRPFGASSSTIKSWQREAEEIDIPGVRLLGPRLRRALDELDRRRRRTPASRGGSFNTNGETESDDDAEEEEHALSPADEVRRRARTLLQSPNGWESVTTIDVSSHSGLAGLANPFGAQHSPAQNASPALSGGARFPQQFGSTSSDTSAPATCTISQRSLDLVKLAEDSLVQARKRAKQLSREIANPSASGGNERRDAKLQIIAELLHALPDIFILHNALMPVLHPQSIWSDPVRALQFANDCSHVSAQCVRLGYELLIASNVREELGRLMSIKFGEDASGEGGMRKAVETAAHGLEAVSQKTTGLGLRVLNRQMIKNSR